MFTAPIGTFESGFAEFVALTEELLPPPNHIPIPPVFGVGPGAPHDRPYDRELAEGVDANGLVDRHSFPASAFSDELGNGIYLVGMIVPDPGVTGRSPDFASGPIIPNSLFPLVVTGIATRNGQPFDRSWFPDWRRHHWTRVSHRSSPVWRGTVIYRSSSRITTPSPSIRRRRSEGDTPTNYPARSGGKRVVRDRAIHRTEEVITRGGEGRSHFLIPALAPWIVPPKLTISG